MKMTTMITTTTNAITKDPEEIVIMNPRQNIMNPQLQMMDLDLDQEMDHANPAGLVMTIAMMKIITKSVPMMEETVVEIMLTMLIAPFVFVMKLILHHPSLLTLLVKA